MTLRPLWIFCAAASLVTQRAGAQVNLDSLRAAHTCASALRIVRVGHPSKNEEWAWSTLPACGTAASSAARDAWLLQRSVTDTLQVASVFDRLWSFRDAFLFDAAMSVAGNASATTESRVFSVMMLAEQLLDRPFTDYRYFSTMPRFGVCRIADVFDRHIQVGTPLAPDARKRARTLAQSLAANSSAPASV